MKSFSERVHEINWQSLEHAYGSAEDVPSLLIGLRSDDPGIRDHAYYELFGNIWHQGTVYPATAHTVPFLFELLDSPLTQDKDSLIALLASIAAGEGYYQVHQPILENINSGVVDRHEELKQEAADVSAVRKVIAPRFADILEQLDNQAEEVRLSVAKAAAYYPEYSEISLPKLRRAQEIETDEEVLEIIEESIETLTVG